LFIISLCAIIRARGLRNPESEGKFGAVIGRVNRSPILDAEYEKTMTILKTRATLEFYLIWKRRVRLPTRFLDREIRLQALYCFRQFWQTLTFKDGKQRISSANRAFAFAKHESVELFIKILENCN